MSAEDWDGVLSALSHLLAPKLANLYMYFLLFCSSLYSYLAFQGWVLGLLFFFLLLPTGRSPGLGVLALCGSAWTIFSVVRFEFGFVYL